MKRKLFATLGLVVASMMVFAGCGGSGDATTSPSADANAASGSKLMVIGSTSVEPLMQKFIDTYTEAQVEMQAPGSSQGIAAAQDGTADIGMELSRIERRGNRLTAHHHRLRWHRRRGQPQQPGQRPDQRPASPKFSAARSPNWNEVGGPTSKSPYSIVSRLRHAQRRRGIARPGRCG